MINATTRNYPNPAYPNRLPNQSLRQRSKQIPRPEIIAPPKTNSEKQWKQARYEQNQHYKRQDLWQEEARESGLTLLTTNEGDLVHNDRGWCDHGQSDTYDRLKMTTSTTLISLAKSLNVDKFPTEFDHINPESCSKLARLRRKYSRAVAVPKIINQLKQKKNSQIWARTIENYDNSSIAEGQSETLDKAEGNLWNSFYKFLLTKLAYQYLVDSNLDLLAFNGYELNRPFAIAEMQSFTQKVQIEDGRDAAIIPFVLMRLLTQLEEVPDTIFRKACFNQKSIYLVPSYIVDSAEQIFAYMSKAILSVEKSLSLSPGCKDVLREIIKLALDHSKVSYIRACNSYLQQWKMKPGFPKQGLESLEKKLNNQDFAKSRKQEYLDSLSELYSDPKCNKLQIQNLSSKEQFEELNLTGRNSSQVFKAWNFDPYVQIHTPIKQDVDVERLQAKIFSIKEGKEGRKEKIGSQSKQLNVTNLIENSDKQLDKITVQISALGETAK